MHTKDNEALLELANTLLRQTLHGSPPVSTTMDLAMGVLELKRQLDDATQRADKAENERAEWRAHAEKAEAQCSAMLAECERRSGYWSVKHRSHPNATTEAVVDCLRAIRAAASRQEDA